ncbi:hypothetical protein ARMGADRAFT_1020683 [Armillaria gallica]|uniref:Uncharacterized protein n=1 Tax=Armillaria gallica TaxID=47427 RepID=A0A2H3CZM1_ARMGA|nr:hypothetical protein ARMGADRAFT_1020683 [Armillaria gallica]
MNVVCPYTPPIPYPRTAYLCLDFGVFCHNEKRLRARAWCCLPTSPLLHCRTSLRTFLSSNEYWHQEADVVSFKNTMRRYVEQAFNLSAQR